MPDTLGSVQRALRVLEVVAEAHDGITAKAIARRLGVGLSSTYHTLNTLIADGYVVRLEDSRSYGLGYKVHYLSRHLSQTLGVPDDVAAAVSELHRGSGAAAYYAVFRDTEVVVAHLADSPEAPRIEPLDVGFNEAAHALAFGKVMLASLPQSRRREYLRGRGLTRLTPHTITDRSVFDAQLRWIAEHGIAVDVEEFGLKLACVAAPVVDGQGAVVGSVSVSVDADDFRRRSTLLQSLVRKGATRVSQVIALHPQTANG
jgi:DNA-binding IclR family transcriptional regulator